VLSSGACRRQLERKLLWRGDELRRRGERKGEVEEGERRERKRWPGSNRRWGRVSIPAIMPGARTHGSVRTRPTTAMDRSSERAAACTP
jgi:hypothetical protein